MLLEETEDDRSEGSMLHAEAPRNGLKGCQKVKLTVRAAVLGQDAASLQENRPFVCSLEKCGLLLPSNAPIKF